MIRRTPAARLRFICLVTVVVFAVVSCGSTSQDEGLRIPATTPQAQPPIHIRQIVSAALDGSRVAIAWVDKSSEGGRLWRAEATLNGGTDFSLTRPTALVDRGRIKDVSLLVRRGQAAFMYIRNDQLLCQWPPGAPMRTLTNPDGQSTISASGIASTAGRAFVCALVIQSREMQRPTFELFGYVVDEDNITTTHLATIALPPNRLDQPPPLLFRAGQGGRLGLFIRLGTLVKTQSGPAHPSGSHPGSAGELLCATLTRHANNTLSMSELEHIALPGDSDLAFASHIVAADSSFQVLAGGRPQVKLVTRSGDSIVVRRISSTIGAGSTVGTPTVQILSDSDSTMIVSWIDTADQLETLSLEEGAADPTLQGGSVQASLLGSNGRVLYETVRGYPTGGPAQAISLGSLGTVPYLAWAQSPDSSSAERSLTLRIKAVSPR